MEKWIVNSIFQFVIINNISDLNIV